MKKIKVGVIYGGLSTEHDISIMSSKSIISALDKNKYETYEIYINKNNIWYDIKDNSSKRIYNIINYLKKLDVVFPVLHGKYGEDGTIQGMFDMNNISYVGCGVMSSSICMDKAYTKILMDKYNIKQLDYIIIEKENVFYKYIDKNYNYYLLSSFELAEKIINCLGENVFVKPSRGGSSIGISKSNKDNLINNIENAFSYDNRVVVEKYCNAIELECAILFGNASSVGEIVSDKNFYDYDEKYKSSSAKILIPASISSNELNYIKKTASKVFQILNCKDLARVDFFMDKDTHEIYFNEINTMPGFTDISMYKKLIEFDGICLSDLLDKLIRNNLCN